MLREQAGEASRSSVQFMHRKPLMIDGWWLIVESCQAAVVVSAEVLRARPQRVN